MTQAAAAELAGRYDVDRAEVRIGLLTHLVHHGVESNCDLDGIDVRDRALLLTDGRRSAMVFDAGSDPQAVLRTGLSLQPFRSGVTQVYSAVCDGSTETLRVATGPRCEPERRPRPTACCR